MGNLLVTRAGGTSCLLQKKEKEEGKKSQVQNLKAMREGKRGECKLFKPAGRAILEC